MNNSASYYIMITATGNFQYSEIVTSMKEDIMQLTEQSKKKKVEAK